MAVGTHCCMKKCGNLCEEQSTNCVDNDSKCGIVHKAPTEPQSLAERTTPKGIPPPILWVVSKCALRDKKGRDAPVARNAPRRLV